MAHQNHLGLDHPCVSNQTPSGLDDDLRQRIAEMDGHGAHDCGGKTVDTRHLVAIPGREPAAAIHHTQIDAGIPEVGEQHCHPPDRRFIRRGVGLLAADMEGQAERVEPEIAGADHERARHLDGCAEFS